MEEWNTYAFGPANGAKPEKAVLMLHGYGSNGQDLISLAPMLAEAAPNAIFLSPDAPFVCDMSAPGNLGGRQWFPLQSFDPGYMLEGIRRSEPILNHYIDQVLQQLELEDADLALLGFSQGTMMSLFAAPRRKKPIAGVIGYSGALLGDAELGGAAIQKVPVVLIHGEDDQVVTFDRHEHAKNALKTHGFDVETLTIPGLPHSIDDAGIKTGAAFLKRVFAR
ncbi:MAG: phospholipase/carboxylesterase [Micavibrio sp.]|nr:phospholipase/carboxylesterase [Micavibrio sp.]